MATKTDNRDPRAKLELRRYFLRKYHAADPPHVLDCCQGGGLLWNQLRKEFAVASYWGIDLKPKKGRLKLDSVRVLAQPGWPQNVIDVDTYGSPWKHWEAMLPNVARPLTVCFTVGKLIGVGGFVAQDKLSSRYLGIESLHCPPALACGLHRLALAYALARAVDFRLCIIEAVEAVGEPGHARYIGVRLQPA